MKKEALTALGLTEEQVNKVIEGYGQMIPKERLDEKISQVKVLTDQNADYNTQLEALKGVDAAGLQAKIEELQTANTLAKTEFDKQLKDTQIRAEVAKAINGKVHDIEMTFGLIDRDALTLENGAITAGLDNQIAALKESKPFLFVPESTATSAKQKLSGAVPHTTTGTGIAEPVSVGAQFAQTANAVPTSAAKNPWGQ